MLSNILTVAYLYKQSQTLMYSNKLLDIFYLNLTVEDFYNKIKIKKINDKNSLFFISAHHRSKPHHKALKLFVHPFCPVCTLELHNRQDWEFHR